MAFMGDTLRELCTENTVAETQTVVMRTPKTFPRGNCEKTDEGFFVWNS